MPPKLFQRATADGYAAAAETAKARLDRLEREYKIKQEKAKRRAKNSGPNLRWKPPVVERLDPTQDAVWRAVVEAPVENEDDDHEHQHDEGEGPAPAAALNLLRHDVAQPRHVPRLDGRDALLHGVARRLDLADRPRDDRLEDGPAVVVEQVDLVDDDQAHELRVRAVAALARDDVPLLRRRDDDLARLDLRDRQRCLLYTSKAADE